MNLPRLNSFLALGLLACGAFTAAFAAEIPALKKNGLATQLMVDGKPYLVLGGELHNSSASSREYMKPVWPKLVQMNLNTVLAVVSWDLVEPVEGKFDFRIVDELLEDARRHNLRLVLLWFGSWKNGLSHYTPAWVKADQKRFPLARLKTGAVEVLSPVSETSAQADARAFAAFMRHLKKADETQRTVIMVQVENEVGLIGDSRDRSELAEAAWKQSVPAELTAHLQKNRETLLPELRAVWQAAGFKAAGTWAEVFGPGPSGEEAFMAWHYARYVERVTAAGKAEYALPMFVNAWIVQPQDQLPGDYPAGGPQAHVLDLWKAGAPSIDMLTPDIYLPNFTEVCAQFARAGGGLFVPESRAGLEGAANAFTAIGQYRAIGYSPFGIESRETDPAGGPIHQAYAVLGALTPLILDHQARGSIAAVSLSAQKPAQKIVLDGYALMVSLRTNRRSTELPERGYALVMQTGPDEFVVAGADVQVTFASSVSNAPEAEAVGLASVEEGTYVDGRWVAGRALNGDEIMISYDMPVLAAAKQSGTGLRFFAKPGIQRARLYRFR